MVARAAMLLECAYLVSRCNHGDWPRWMKMPGGVPHSRSQPSGYRRNLLLQRTTGRLFHQWAEVSSVVTVLLRTGGFFYQCGAHNLLSEGAYLSLCLSVSRSQCAV